MEVHLITLPNRNSELLDSLVKSLPDGPELKFMKVGSFASEYTTRQLHGKLMNVDLFTPLEFNRFFYYCEWYRKDQGVAQDTIVVFITDVKNRYLHGEKNQNGHKWFSAVQANNIFVYTEIWNDILPERKEYAIAYNIMVNVFQSLLHINFNKHHQNADVIHFKNIGCLNDRCNGIEDIVLKLRTGYICDTCIRKAREMNISNDMILQIYQTIKGIRENFLNFDEIQKSFIPEKLVIDSKGNFSLNNKTISLTLFQKAIFIFCARHIDGVEISDFYKDENKKEMIDIYHTLRLNFLKAAGRFVRRQDFERNEEPINRLCLTNFLYHKSKINERLRKYIGDEKSKTYLIVNYHCKSDDGDRRYLYKIFNCDFVSNEFEF